MHGAKPLVKGMAESVANTDDNAEEIEVEVDVRAVYKELITLSETNSDSEVDDSKGKTKLRIAVSIAALLTVLRLQTLSNGSDEGVMDEDGDSNEDDVKEYAMEMMTDLAEVDGDLLCVNSSAK